MQTAGDSAVAKGSVKKKAKGTPGRDDNPRGDTRAAASRGSGLGGSGLGGSGLGGSGVGGSAGDSAGGTERRADWRIASFARHCQRCRAPFLAGQAFFSYLRIDAEERIGFERLDHCEACWPAQLAALRAASERADEPAPIFWRTRRPRERGVQHVVDLVSMRALFEQLLGDERDEVEALRYVVGLMLARKKAIRVIRGAGGARGDLTFKDPREGREEQRVRLPVPRLDEATIEALKQQLGDILQG